MFTAAEATGAVLFFDEADAVFGKRTEVRFKCMFVAARCGYRFQYAFDDEVVARAMRIQWGNIPPVFYIPRTP